MHRLFSSITISLILIGIWAPLSAWAQTYLSGAYIRAEVEFEDKDFTVYTFSRKQVRQGTVRAKYFAKDANNQFAKWRQGKKVLFYCSGAFSVNWDTDSPPVGICVDNGQIVNRNLDEKMDGLVIVYNGGKQKGGIAVVNIDKEPVTVNQGGRATYNLRNSRDRVQFLSWASDQDATVFQTQLMFSKKYQYGFSEEMLTHGSRAERRFLAICMRKGVVYHIVVDYPDEDYLNKAANRVTRYLSEKLGYDIFGLFNLDTGGKNIMKAYDSEGSQVDRAGIDVDEATNLLIYYLDNN